MNRDFVEMLSALTETGAEFLVVGAHALAAHGVPRATGDLDIWVRGSGDNAKRVLAALEKFGAPLFDLTISDLTTPGTVYQIGVPPSRIDILTSISGVTFEQAWARRLTVEIEGISVPILGKEEFIVNKRAVGRPKDLSDLDLLAEADRQS
jgi:predicted nucleotidyltransferase